MSHSYCPKNTPYLRLGVLQLLFCLEFSDSSSRRSREPLLLTFLLNLQPVSKEAVAVWLWIPSSLLIQRLVTVPFWEYWTSPEKVAIIDHIPNGWVMFNGDI
jgi:hypothetical protein